MKITVKRTGGYAGLSEDIAAVDTAELTPVATQKVERMVQNMRFFDLPANIQTSTIGADLFYYEIKVTDAGHQHIIGFYHNDDPETLLLRQFVETLIQLK